MKSSNKIKLYVFFIFSTLFVYSQNLTIESGGSLTIDQNKSLTVSGSVTNNGTLIMNSSSNQFSTMTAGSSSGSSYTYNRYVASTSTFDLISAPFTGQTFSNLLSNNSGVIYDNPSDATQYVYGPFNNDSGHRCSMILILMVTRQWMLVLDLERELIVELH